MPSLLMRDLLVRDPLSDAKDTLSSWDKCMAKDYCKWPVIVAIVVGSLIVISVVFCVARCVCCGAEVACCCFKCCTCCCPSGGRKSDHKRMGSEPPPPVYGGPPSNYALPPPPAPVDTRPVNQQYRSHAAPSFTSQPQSKPELPQFATFESSSKKANDDALPAMPIWNDARKRYVEEEVMPEKNEEMEMERLDHNGSMTNSSVAGATAGGATVGAAAIGNARRSPGPGRPPVQPTQNQNSYGFPAVYHQNDSFVSSAPQRSPHDSPGPYGGGSPYGQQPEDYRGISPVHSNKALSPVYGAGAGFAQSQPYGRRSPNPPNQGYNQYNQYAEPPRHTPSPPSAGGYVYSPPSNDQYDQYSAPPMNQYAPPAVRTNTPGYNAPPNDTHNQYAPPAPRSNTPGYPPSPSSRYDSPAPAAPAYPGQQTYHASEASYPGQQQSYRAYSPAVQPQEQQNQPIQRKPVESSWRDL